MEQDIDSSDFARRRFEEKHQASLENIKRTKEETLKKREEDTDPQESRDKFESDFNTRLENIRKSLSSITSTDPVNDICEQLKHNLNECTELLNISTHFLHPYTIKLSQQSIQTTLESINKTQTELAPRKKFAFSRAKQVKKEEEKKQEVATVLSVEIELEGIQNQSNQTFIRRNHELREINCYQLKDLTDCDVFLLGNLKAIHMLRLIRCRVYIGPVSGAAHISECQDCSISVACHQLRIHTSVKCKFYVHCATNPIVESVSQAYFAPYNLKYDELTTHLQTANLDIESKWSNIQDFKWLKQSKSPNWDILPESERLEYTFKDSSSN